jgi:hypothetical protein
MAKKIRVLRVLEYVYDDVEEMERDMSHWQLGATGTRTNRGGIVRSTVLPLEVLDHEDVPNGD